MRRVFGNPQGGVTVTGQGCLHLLSRSQTNNRAHFPPSFLDDRPPGSEGRVTVVKPRQEEACWAITCLMTQPFVSTATVPFLWTSRHTSTVYGYNVSLDLSDLNTSLIHYVQDMSAGDPLTHLPLDSVVHFIPFEHRLVSWDFKIIHYFYY